MTRKYIFSYNKRSKTILFRQIKMQSKTNKFTPFRKILKILRFNNHTYFHS